MSVSVSLFLCCTEETLAQRAGLSISGGRKSGPSAGVGKRRPIGRLSFLNSEWCLGVLCLKLLKGLIPGMSLPHVLYINRVDDGLTGTLTPEWAVVIILRLRVDVSQYSILRNNSADSLLYLQHNMKAEQQ